MSWCVLAYAYRTVSGNRSSAQVEFRNVRNSAGTLLEGKKYTYDALGNITMISQSTGSYYPLVAYEYDAQSQLVKETYYNGNGTGSSNVTATYTYTYDTAGNISSAVGDGMTISYTYDNTDWVDLLTSVTYNGTKKSISYDAVGNPMNWYNGTVYTALTWTQGRRLSSLKKGSTSISYAYDMDGVRTTKIAGNEKHEYVTQNGKVVRELVTNKTTGAFIRCLDFLYDESGRPFAMRNYWNSSLSGYDTYHYILNAQGDVVQITYQGGTVKATYTYDAWGQVLTADGELAAMNPIRYRGYYYDTDTGFYYLQSRYYDPIIKRFLNADSYESTGQGFIGTNMFAYCNNNPVNCRDDAGNAAGGLITTTRICDGGNAYVPPDGLYYTPDDAAIVFCEEYYFLTKTQGKEYCAYIYAETIRGCTYYSFGSVEAGIYNAVWSNNKRPNTEFVKAVGYIHTHPYPFDPRERGEAFVFSDADIAAYSQRKDLSYFYLATPDCELLLFDLNASDNRRGIFIGRFSLKNMHGGKPQIPLTTSRVF